MNETRGTRYLFSEEIKGYNETQPTPMPNLDRTLSLSNVMRKVNAIDSKIVQLAENINKIAYNMEVMLHRLSTLTSGTAEEYPDREMPEPTHYTPPRNIFSDSAKGGSDKETYMGAREDDAHKYVRSQMEMFFGPDRENSEEKIGSFVRNPYSAFFDMPLSRMVNMDRPTSVIVEENTDLLENDDVPELIEVDSKEPSDTVLKSSDTVLKSSDTVLEPQKEEQNIEYTKEALSDIHYDTSIETPNNSSESNTNMPLETAQDALNTLYSEDIPDISELKSIEEILANDEEEQKKAKKTRKGRSKKISTPEEDRDEVPPKKKPTKMKLARKKREE